MEGSPLAGRPLVSLTFALNYAADGLNVRGYRLVNIALHVACALLLFVIVGQAFVTWPAGTTHTGSSRDVAFAAALLWLVHPLNTEAVDYVSQRTELMMAAFMLLTLYFGGPALVGGSASPDRPLGGTRPTSPARPIASVICCGLGMMCKETMAVAPMIVVLHDRTFVFGSFGDAWRARWRHYVALAATWLIVAVLLWSSPRGNSAGFAGASVTPWTYLLDQSVMIVRYLRLTVWPRDLVLDYGVPTQVTFAQVAPYAIAVGALLAATIVAVVRHTRIGFLGAWFFLTLAPTSSVIPISTEVGAERRMYLPLMAVAVLAATLIARVVTAQRAPLIAASLAVLLSAATIQRNEEYLSGLALWQSVVDRWPPHGRAHQNLAAELKLAGRRDEEVAHLREAAKDIPEIRNVLGVELTSLNRNDEAVAELQQYVRDYPRDSDGWSNLGNALVAAGHGADAIRAYQRAVDVDPNNSLSQRNLALAGQEKIDAAIAEFRTSLALRPADNDAAGYLDRALKVNGVGDK